MKVAGCYTIRSLYLEWVLGHTSGSSGDTNWNSGTKISYPLSATDQAARFEEKSFTFTVPNNSPGIEIDLRIVLDCIDTSLSSSMPLSHFVKEMIRESSNPDTGINPIASPSLVSVELWGLVPSSAENLVYQPTQEPVNRLRGKFPFSTKQSLTIIPSSYGTSWEMSANLAFDASINGFRGTINAPWIKQQASGSSATIQVVLFSTSRNVGAKERLGPVVPLIQSEPNLYQLPSGVSLGGYDLVGKTIYIRAGNLRVSGVVTFSQSRECLSSTSLCIGTNSRSYGLAQLTNPQDEATYLIQVFIMQNQDGSFSFKGRIDTHHKSKFVDDSNKLQLKFANTPFSVTVTPESSTSWYSFSTSINLPSIRIKPIGQVLLLYPPGALKSGPLLLPISLFSSTSLPVSATHALDLPVHLTDQFAGRTLPFPGWLYTGVLGIFLLGVPLGLVGSRYSRFIRDVREEIRLRERMRTGKAAKGEEDGEFGEDGLEEEVRHRKRDSVLDSKVPML